MAVAVNRSMRIEDVKWDISEIKKSDFLKVGFLNILTTFVWHNRTDNHYRKKFAHYEWEKRRHAIVELICQEQPAVLGLCELDLTQVKYLQSEMKGYELFGFSSETKETIEVAVKKYGDQQWEKYGSFVALLVDMKRMRVEQLKCHPFESCGQKWKRILIEAHLIDLVASRAFVFLVSHFDHEKPEARRKSGAFELALMQQLENQSVPWLSVGDRNWDLETAEAEAKPYISSPFVVDMRDQNEEGCFGLPGTFIYKMPATVVTVDTGYRSQRLTQGVVYYTRTGAYDSKTGQLLQDEAISTGCGTISDHLMFIAGIRFPKK